MASWRLHQVLGRPTHRDVQCHRIRSEGLQQTSPLCNHFLSSMSDHDHIRCCVFCKGDYCLAEVCADDLMILKAVVEGNVLPCANGLMMLKANVQSIL